MEVKRVITLWLIGLLVKFCFLLLYFPFWLMMLPFRMLRDLFGRKQPVRRHPTYQDGLWEGLIISSLFDD